MDIQQWLAATADSVPPERSDDGRIPDAFRPHPPSRDRQQRVGRSYRRKYRKRASSDSSIINTRPADRRRAPAAPRSLPSKRARSAESADREAGGSAHSSPGASLSPEPAPEKTYERRQRHKTRPDRYEPKQRKRKGEDDAHKERKPGKKRRKSHRSGDGGRTAGVVQSFQLKNGPKNSRLTMKPGATAGLFKHGRASAQVTGRGEGLPDLVFNEMRFLQRPTEHQDAPAPTIEQQQPSKKDRKRPNDGDISAYFDAKKPAHEQRLDIPPFREDLREDRREHRRRTSEVHEPRNIAPPVELPSKPFLGFGSKGGQAENKEADSEHTSYLSWSQTPPREPLVARNADISASFVNANKPSIRKPQDQHSTRQKSDADHSDKARGDPQQRASARGQRVQNRRAKGPEVIEIYQPPPDAREHQTADRRSTTKTTSQSLPNGFTTYPSDHQQRSSDQLNDNYHTSDILKVHQYADLSHQARAEDRGRRTQIQIEKENPEPLSSCSIDRLLHDARHLAATAANEPERAPIVDHIQSRCFDAARIAPPTIEPRPALQVRGETTHHFVLEARKSGSARRVSASTGRRAYLPPYANHIAEISPRVDPTHRRLQSYPVADILPQEQHVPDDDEMLDHGQDFDQNWTLREPVYATIQQAEDLAYGARSNPTPGFYEAESVQLKSEATSFLHRHERTPSNTLLGRSLSIGRSVSVGRTVLSERIAEPASDDGMEGMEGFWKPNKLY